MNTTSNTADASVSVTTRDYSDAAKGIFPTSGFSGNSGELVRKQHLDAGGCVNTTGGIRFVL